LGRGRMELLLSAVSSPAAGDIFSGLGVASVDVNWRLLDEPETKRLEEEVPLDQDPTSRKPRIFKLTPALKAYIALYLDTTLDLVLVYRKPPNLNQKVCPQGERRFYYLSPKK